MKLHRKTIDLPEWLSYYVGIVAGSIFDINVSQYGEISWIIFAGLLPQEYIEEILCKVYTSQEMQYSIKCIKNYPYLRPHKQVVVFHPIRICNIDIMLKLHFTCYKNDENSMMLENRLGLKVW